VTGDKHSSPDLLNLSGLGLDNAEYIDAQYTRWRDDPNSVDTSWQLFFKGFHLRQEMAPVGAADLPDDARIPTDYSANEAAAQSRVASLIYAYRNHGHLIADINPLHAPDPSSANLDISTFGFDDSDLDRVFNTGHLHVPDQLTLREIIAMLKETYCGPIGVQYTHIEDTDVRRWLQEQMEPTRNKATFDRDDKLEILSHLIDAETFESFIQTRYPGQKRFSLEGAESAIPAIHHIVEAAPEYDIAEIVMGMAHRGRLNVLANILDKSYAMIFSEFEGKMLSEAYAGDGDVKYHKGYSSEHRNRWGRSVHLSLTSNPSHLEAVDPVTLGKVRAKQRQRGDQDSRKKVLGLLLHGDAAFAGQGMIAEVLNMSQLKGYRTGGTVHLIINNQIGFTTDPSDSRSSPYSTDIAKMIDAPIFHVNGDDPEAVVAATDLALRFRQEFGRDVVVDMLCYRKHGHNEGDEPAFTQPKLYAIIKKHSSTRQIYTDRLIAEGQLSKDEADKIADELQTQLQRHFEYARSEVTELEVQSYDDYWSGLEGRYTLNRTETGVKLEDLITVGKALNTVPDGFSVNRKILRQLPKRMEALENNGSIDWSTAESLAWGTLLAEGTPVRLSGQDSIRGTFSQRHSGWTDGVTGEKYFPLNNILDEQGHFCAYNSPLAEQSILGFEYGYSLAEPRMLIHWEAQFGDFTNGAQMIVDQFITSSESKWQRSSGLVLLLPHGYEGQGPEHSNAYLERYLAACAEENIQVCNISTPAQYFHALRRQIHQPFRKPLIIMAPKSMLRDKRATSPVNDLTSGHFQEIMDDPTQPMKARRIILCSGKIYHDLDQKREEDDLRDAALIRVEQFYPTRDDLLREIVGRYKNAKEIVWVQEETKNRGGWTFMYPLLRHLFPELKIRYVGRAYAASPATGSLNRHRQEQELIVNMALTSSERVQDETVLPDSFNKLLHSNGADKKSAKAKPKKAKA
jgi:2-oxoglutarate dehydrogenase E1 component